MSKSIENEIIETGDNESDAPVSENEKDRSKSPCFVEEEGDEIGEDEDGEDEDGEDEDNDDVRLYEDDDEDDVDGNLYGHKKSKPDFSTGAPPGSFEMYSMSRKDLEDRRVKHHEVIRKILAEFDLEEVKERYRGQSMAHDFGHTNRRFRMWLEKVMGNDNVQLSDQKWHDLFRQKVMEDYEHKLNERERQLAEAEVQRIQRLRLQGILNSDTPKKNGKRNGHRSKKISHRTYRDHSLRHQGLYSRPLDDIETQMEILTKLNETKNPAEEARENSSPRDNDDGQEYENVAKGGVYENYSEPTQTKNKSSSNQEYENVAKGGVYENYSEPTQTKNKSSNNKGGTKATKTKDRKGTDRHVTKAPLPVDDDDGGKSRPDASACAQEDESSKKTISTKDASPSSNNGHVGLSGQMRPDKNPTLQCLYKEENLRQLYVQAETLIRPSARRIK